MNFRKKHVRALHMGAKKIASFGTSIAVPIAKNAHKSVLRAIGSVGKSIPRVVKPVHHHVAKKPHNRLMAKNGAYARWHHNEKHGKIHASLLAGCVVLVLAFLVNSYIRTYAAPDLTSTWDFSTPSDYTLDSGLEISGNTVQLKAQEYADDSNTRALYHLNETSGATATDSSSNSNDATSATPPTFGTGILGNGATFDGANDRLKAPDTASLSLNFANTLEGWTKFDSTFSASSHNQRQTVLDKGSYKLYYDNTDGKIKYEMADNGSTTWTQAAGDDVNGSWDSSGHTYVHDSVADGSGNIYVGLGINKDDAEVWKWDGSTWEKIGGDDINSGWNKDYEQVTSLAYGGGNLYAGLGRNTNDAEVWRWNGTSWTQIGGDSLNSGWTTGFETVGSMVYSGGNLYAGLGNSGNDARLYRWNGTSWTWMGGFGITGTYNAWSANYEEVGSIAVNGSDIYVGMNRNTNDADVWRLSGTTWTQIGGDSLNSGWGSGYEYARSLFFQGGNLYAGLGQDNNEAEVWRWNGTAWSQIGGDGVNSSWSANRNMVFDIVGDGTNLYVGLGWDGAESDVWTYNGSTWTQLGGGGLNSSWPGSHRSAEALTYDSGILYVGLGNGPGGDFWKYESSAWSIIGGDGVNNSWGLRDVNEVNVMTSYNGKLYAGTGDDSEGDATVWEFDGSDWDMVGGQALNGSWARDSYDIVSSMETYNGNLYVGLGNDTGEAEVWRYNGSTWTKVGGDGINSGWADSTYEYVFSLATFNGQLCAGLGWSNLDSEVWCYNGSIWTKIGGDGVNSSWNSGYEAVYTLLEFNGQLYAGIGNSTNDGEVWRYNGSTWTQIGGDTLNSSWGADGQGGIYTLAVYDGSLIAGVSRSFGSNWSEVWSWNGSAWTQIGGSGINSSWADGDARDIGSITEYNGALYVGLNLDSAGGEVWRYNGSSWSKIGGDSINDGFSEAIDIVPAMTVYDGKLYAGLGDGANVDASIWSYGNNQVLASSTVGQDTSWHHIAASYDGTDMKIYIDGAEDASKATSNLMPDNSYALHIGAASGSTSASDPGGYFKGAIDEVRVSNTARSSFITQAYAATNQYLTLNDAAYTTGIKQWDTFSAIETPNGGTLRYRVSADDGDTWLYWDGDSWEASADATQSNAVADINSNFTTFPVTFEGMKWQAIFKGDGTQQVILGEVGAEATSDITDPSSNASNITAYKTNDGTAFAQNAWTNGGSPYFEWDAAADADAGIKGYCLYLGQDNTADPVSTKGLLGTSPEETGGLCQFLISTESIDLATAGYLGTALSTSDSPYYLSIKAIDNAGNIFDTSAQFYFRFDNTPPSNPGYITAPSGFLTEKEATMTWPTSGGNAAADANSGVAGLQYKIGETTWYGDSHTGTGDTTDLLTDDGSYTTQDPPDYDNLVDGVNTVYFRTWDQAGNVTTTYVTAALKINTSGAPSEPQNLSVTPATNTTNAFAFDWDEPEDFLGESTNLTYCYTVNTLPSADTCTYTSAGVTALGAGPYATQPGSNTFYVVARDETNSINYSSYTSITFTANTPSPGIPTNMDVVDVSIKATSNWRLALTWNEPSYEGAGISSYKIYRSLDNSSFSFVGSSTSTTYIDAGLSQQDYYYYVKACDSTNNCGANSTIVDEVPTGRFTEPANLVSSPVVSGVTTKKATIRWSTDRESDSRIALGTTSGRYSSSEVTVSDQVTAHEIELDNLSAGTTYYFAAKWTDEDGNTAQSQEFVFKTAPAPTLKEVKTLRTGLNSALIQFTTRDAVRAEVVYGRTESFGGVEKINTSLSESTYTVDLNGLDDGTKYFYKIILYDNEGTGYDGSIFSFVTPARPRITNLRFQPVKGEPTSTQQITWDTNVSADSTVTFGKLNTNGKDVFESKLVTSHEVLVRGLEDDSEYFVIAQSRDADGNLAVSDKQTFRTALDTRPPKVTGVTVESSIRGTGAEARGQIIVSWTTDELATSQVAFSEGTNVTTFNNRTTEDTELSLEHIVVISDLPTSQVFTVQPVSADQAGNNSAGESQTAIIGRATDGVLTIIINTLRKIFGF